MAVRADDGERFYMRIQSFGDLARAGFGGKQTIFMSQHGRTSTFVP
jgi:hypothetical protein